jgi:hypothetical protein
MALLRIFVRQRAAYYCLSLVCVNHFYHFSRVSLCF